MNITIEDGVNGIIEDTFMYSLDATKNYGASTIFRVGTSTFDIALLRVDLSDYTGISIGWVNFSLYTFLGRSSNSFYYRVLRDWGEGSGAAETAQPGECSWHDYAVPNDWTVGGCNGAGTDHEATAQNESGVNLEDGWDDLVCKPESVMLDLGSRFSVVIKSSDGNAAQIRSGEASSDSPTFYMEYIEAGDGGGIPRSRIINLGGV